MFPTTTMMFLKLGLTTAIFDNHKTICKLGDKSINAFSFLILCTQVLLFPKRVYEDNYVSALVNKNMLAFDGN